MNLRLLAPLAAALAAVVVLFGAGTARADSPPGCSVWANSPYMYGTGIWAEGGFDCGSSFYTFWVTVCLQKYDRTLDYWGNLTCDDAMRGTATGVGHGVHYWCLYAGFGLYRTWTEVYYEDTDQYDWATSNVAYNCSGY
jgi:hypothetical protein